MLKKLFIIFFLIISISNFCNANAITLTSKSEFQQDSYYDVSININFNEMDEEIYFLQGQLIYDINIFEKIETDDITLSNGWHDIVFNSDNGMFVVEYDNSNNVNTQNIMKIKVKTKENIESENTNITIANIKKIGENEVESELDRYTLEIKLVNNNNDGNNHIDKDKDKNEDKGKDEEKDNQSNIPLPFVGLSAPKIFIIIFIILIILYVIRRNNKK